MPTFTYPVKLTRDRKDGGYVVSCRDIPEVIFLCIINGLMRLFGSTYPPKILS
jgi:hypothetical protein